MKDMIKQIVEADAEAKAFDEENQKSKEALAKEIDAQAKVIYDSYMSKADETIERRVLILTRTSDISGRILVRSINLF